MRDNIIIDALIDASICVSAETPGEREAAKALLLHLNEIVNDMPIYRVVTVLYLMMEMMSRSAMEKMEQRGDDGINPN